LKNFPALFRKDTKEKRRRILLHVDIFLFPNNK
jgi:hypothetical protein